MTAGLERIYHTGSEIYYVFCWLLLLGERKTCKFLFSPKRIDTVIVVQLKQFRFIPHLVGPKSMNKITFFGMTCDSSIWEPSPAPFFSIDKFTCVKVHKS